MKGVKKGKVRGGSGRTRREEVRNKRCKLHPFLDRLFLDTFKYRRVDVWSRYVFVLPLERVCV